VVMPAGSPAVAGGRRKKRRRSRECGQPGQNVASLAEIVDGGEEFKDGTSSVKHVSVRTVCLAWQSFTSPTLIGRQCDSHDYITPGYFSFPNATSCCNSTMKT
jgi:hypothetical protein